MFKKIGKLVPKYNLRSTASKLIKKKRNRSGQRKFREKLKDKYQDKCPLLGIHGNLCDAAHILPYADCKKNKDKYNENNGILLSATLHKAYDRNYFIIDEKTCQIKILYENLKKEGIEDPKEIGLDGLEDFYIKELDNQEGKNFLKRRNSSLELD